MKCNHKLKLNIATHLRQPLPDATRILFTEILKENNSAKTTGDRVQKKLTRHWLL